MSQDFPPDAGSLHGEIPDTPESRAFFKELMLNKANAMLAFRQNPDNHFLFCPLSFACGHLENYGHHLYVPGFTWCVDCDRDCSCMEATDGYE